jgi:hypothetical protein
MNLDHQHATPILYENLDCAFRHRPQANEDNFFRPPTSQHRAPTAPQSASQAAIANSESDGASLSERLLGMLEG